MQQSAEGGARRLCSYSDLKTASKECERRANEAAMEEMLHHLRTMLAQVPKHKHEEFLRECRLSEWPPRLHEPAWRRCRHGGPEPTPVIVMHTHAFMRRTWPLCHATAIDQLLFLEDVILRDGVDPPARILASTAVDAWINGDLTNARHYLLAACVLDAVAEIGARTLFAQMRAVLYNCCPESPVVARIEARLQQLSGSNSGFACLLGATVPCDCLKRARQRGLGVTVDHWEEPLVSPMNRLATDYLADWASRAKLPPCGVDVALNPCCSVPDYEPTRTEPSPNVPAAMGCTEPDVTAGMAPCRGQQERRAEEDSEGQRPATPSVQKSIEAEIKRGNERARELKKNSRRAQAAYATTLHTHRQRAPEQANVSEEQILSKRTLRRQANVRKQRQMREQLGEKARRREHGEFMKLVRQVGCRSPAEATDAGPHQRQEVGGGAEKVLGSTAQQQWQQQLACNVAAGAQRGEQMRREVAGFVNGLAVGVVAPDAEAFADGLARRLLAGGDAPCDIAAARAVYGGLAKAFCAHDWNDPLLVRVKVRAVLAAAAHADGP